MLKKILLISIISFFSLNIVIAQTVNQNTGWLLVLNSTKFNDKWGAHFDFQLRTQNNWDGVRNVLIRPGLTYYINKKSNATLGYLYVPTFIHDDVVGSQLKNPLTEHRIWQQYIYNQQPWKTATLAHRFRLEQRFIERQTDELFSQRFRYFVRLLQPIKKQEAAFTKGMFVALQNEIFLNLQNKEDLNDHFFDQNRVYIAAGYRFSKALDIELGYLNQLIKGKANNTVNNAVQLAFYTRF